MCATSPRLPFCPPAHEKHRALTREIRRYNRNARRTGLADAERALTLAYRHEEDAMLAVTLARPSTDAEAKAKRRYMKRAPAFREGWQDAQLGRILVALTKPEAGQ